MNRLKLMSDVEKLKQVLSNLSMTKDKAIVLSATVHVCVQQRTQVSCFVLHKKKDTGPTS